MKNGKFRFSYALASKMLAMQDGFNSSLHPEWYNPLKCNRDDGIAVIVEVGEFLDHIGYKWWKKQETDVGQAKMELVDIYHFLMSSAVQLKFSMAFVRCGVLNSEESVTEQGFDEAELKAMAFNATLSTIGESVFRMYYQTELLSFSAEDQEEKVEIIKVFSRELIEYTDKATSARSARDEEEESAGLTLEYSNEAMTTAFSKLFELMHIMGMTYEELYLLYVGKNTLNKFRQAFGYKEGTYIKRWNGREDNEVLTAFIKSLGRADVGIEDFDANSIIYDHLERHYPG